MRRGAISVLVGVIGALIVAFVLFGLSGKLGQLLGERGIGQDRSIAPFVNAYLRDPIFRKEVLKIEFPIQTIYIGKEKVAWRIDEVENANRIGYFEPQLKTREEMERNRAKIWEYKVNSLVAYEMEDCWHDMGEGRLPVFPDWYKHVEGGLDESDLAKSWEEYMGRSNKDKDMPPVFCVICAKIEIGEEVRNELRQDVKDSLMHYIRTHRSKANKDISIADYLRNPTDSALYNREYSYRTTEPFAVVFARINVLRWKEQSQWLLKTAGLMREENADKDFSALVLAPYAELDLYCSHLANS